MTPARPKLLFWVQHLLGIGHLRRAATLARALCSAGFDVKVVSGGLPVPGLDVGTAAFVQLPPTRAVDVYFKVLVDETGKEIDDAWRENRKNRLLEVYDDFRPDILLTELFPFGRRQLRSELVPLLEYARSRERRPLIACSVRDILVAPAKDERMREMLERARRYYDLVLIHGDPDLVSFDETFPHMAEIADLARYTGYVVDRGAGAAAPASRTDGVIVSAGGGAVSEPLLRAALAARPLTQLASEPWRVLVGHSLSEEVYAELRAAAPAGVTVERARPDFTSLLRTASLSLSQGGYNTVMEVLDAGIRAVIVPYAGGLETEQTLRARRLAERSVLQVVEESELTPDAVAAAVDRAAAGPPATLAGLDTSGAEVTPRLLREALARLRDTPSP